MQKLSAIREAVKSVGRHRFIRLIDEYYFDAGLPEGAVFEIKFEDESGELAYPIRAIQWNDVPTELIKSAERANQIAHFGFVFLATLRKVAFGIAALADQSISDYQALVAIEYHAENYFTRLSAAVEQLHRLVSAVLGLPTSDRDTQRQLSERIARSAPLIASRLGELRERLQGSKARLDEVAHCAGYDDGWLSGLRACLNPALEFLPRHEPSQQYLSTLQRYRGQFVADICAEFDRFVTDIATVFDSLVPVAQQSLFASWGKPE